LSLARPSQWPADKAHARNAILGWRKNLTSTQRDALTQQISVRLQSRLTAVRDEQNRSLSIGVYWPIRNEPDLRDCFRNLSDNGIEFALPITPSSPAPLTFTRWREGDPMQKDTMGIEIPVSLSWPNLPDCRLASPTRTPTCRSYKRRSLISVWMKF